MKAAFGISTLSLAALTLAAPVQAESERPPMTQTDLATMDRLGDATVSGDARQMVFSVTQTDRQSYERTSNLYIRDLADRDATAARLKIAGKASHPQFASDGWLYFLLSKEDEESACDCTSEANEENRASEPSETQVWRMALDEYERPIEMMPVTDVLASPAGFLVSPDSSKIALFGAVPLACASFGCEVESAYKPGPGDGLLFEGNEAVRLWDSYETPGEYNRIFIFDLVEGRATGKGIPADGGMAIDSPVPPFGDANDLAWASDSSGLYFSGLKPAQTGYAITNRDIYFSNLTDSSPVNLTLDNPATDASPAISPDGRSLAYAATSKIGHFGDIAKLVLVELASGVKRSLASEYDRSIGALKWAQDSSAIYAVAEDRLDQTALRIDPVSGAIETLDLMAGNEGSISSLIPLSDGNLVFKRDSVGSPPELFLSERLAQAIPVTDVATGLMGERSSVVTTRFSFAGAEGTTVWGQVHKPEKTAGELPLVLFVHGGPHGTFNDSWSYRWNPRLIASHGYAVVSIDFHGSSGYGSAFVDAIRADWGGKPLIDLQKGLLAALAQDPEIDGSRACVMGGSYGGYMMNWIAGNWPDRFDCIVNHAGLFDLRSMYYTTEIPGFMQWEMGGKRPDEDPAAYARHNPADFVQNWDTPMLVIHGEKDYRVPYSQGLMTYSALVERNIPAQLLIYPEENHWVLGAANSIQWYDTVFAWLDRWLKPHD